MNIDKEIEAIEKLIDKYGSRKSLSAIVGMYLVSMMQIPSELMWLQAVQIGGIAALGIAAVVCQWHLDKENDKR